MSEREPCVSVGYTGREVHHKNRECWEIYWLPKGYGPTHEDRQVCTVYFESSDDERHGLAKGKRPPIVEAVCDAVEEFMRQHGDDAAGFLMLDRTPPTTAA